MVSSRKAIAIDVSKLLVHVAQIKEHLEKVNISAENIEEANDQVSTAIRKLESLGDLAAAIHDQLIDIGPSLLTIPQEIRNLIFGYLILEDDYVLLSGHTGPRRCKNIARNYLALSLTCNQLGCEVVELFWGGNSFTYIPQRLDSRSKMCANHLRLIKRLEIECSVDLESPAGYHMVVINCWKSEIECNGYVWSVSENKLKLLKQPTEPTRHPEQRPELLAEKLRPMLKTVQSSIKHGVLEWKTLQDAHRNMLELAEEQFSIV